LTAVEGAVGLQYDLLNDLSEQELVDCDVDNGGCEGGIFTSPLNYIETYGISLYDDYPYRAVVGTCLADNTRRAAAIVSFVGVSSCDVVATQIALQEIGPLSVSIDASCETFMYYSGGVFDVGCGAVNNNHAVALVGYNTDPNNEWGVSYWIAKNSWGTTWGEHGYMYLSMASVDPASASGSACGVCNLLKQPFGVYPNSSITYVNKSFPSPKIDSGDDDDALCDHVEFFGKSIGGTKNSAECSAVKWLAAPHSVLTWFLVLAVTALITLVLSSVVRRLCLCCCPLHESNEPPPRRTRNRNRNRSKNNMRVLVVEHSDLDQVLLGDEDGYNITAPSHRS